MNKVHQDAKVIHNSVMDIKAVQCEMMTMARENSEILTQFQQLTDSLGDSVNRGEKK
jgi:hypothetical protein